MKSQVASTYFKWLNITLLSKTKIYSPLLFSSETDGSKL